MSEYWIIDTETASLQGGIVEIAGIQISPTTLAVIDEFDYMVNPERPIDPCAQAVHGISDADVADAKTMAEHFPEGKVIDPYWLGHNCTFDVRMCKPHIIPKAALCTLKLSKQFIPGMPNYKLQTLKEQLGLSDQAAHRALGDCKTTLELLHVLVDRSGLDLDALFARSNAPKMVTKMPFGKHKGAVITSLPAEYRQWLLGLPELDADLRYTLNQLKGI